MAEAFLTENLPEATFGAPKAGAGMWASCIRLFNPINGRTIQVKIQGIGIKEREMTLVWHEKASRTALQTSSV